LNVIAWSLLATAKLRVTCGRRVVVGVARLVGGDRARANPGDRDRAPETVQTAGVCEEKATASPEEALAETPKGGSPKVRPASVAEG
jgi:hypothetical protein